MTVTNLIRYISRDVSNAPLVLFRIAFGLLMIISTARFMAMGWVSEFYVQPQFHFAYYGFEWIRPLSEWAIQSLFITLLVTAFFMMIGLLYRLTSVVFFLGFTYVELIDKTYYLNHYYFVSLVAFVMIWLPAHRRFSLDALWRPKLLRRNCRFYEVGMLRMLAGIVYFYAGLAKLNADWLLRAMPLKIWLPAKANLPIIGKLLTSTWAAYVFSWFGAVYDLLVPFALSSKSTRILAYISVVVFHTLTAILFPIGVFPYVMIVTALIFFPTVTQEKWLSKLEAIFRVKSYRPYSHPQVSGIKMTFFGVLLLFQLVFPWRYLLYPGSLFWHEQGYRFSWRVMLMEKVGLAEFRVVDDAGNAKYVDNKKFITPLQEKMMATQPDMILQFAHYLEGVYRAEGMSDPKVFVDAYVTLNGSDSKRFIDPTVDLTEIEDSWENKRWVLSYD